LLYDTPGGLYDKDSLRELSIEFYDPNYHSILVDSFWVNPGFRLPADVYLGTDTAVDVGVRYKGNSSFCGPWLNNNPKIPLNLDMNYWVGGQKLKNYKKIKLSNAWPDATFVREYSASKIYRRYVPTYEVNLMRVLVQGDYLGLYVNTESINKQFLEKHFNEKDGVLIKGDAPLTACFPITYTGFPSLEWYPVDSTLAADSTLFYPHYEIKSDHGWTELSALIETLNFNPTQLDTILNVDRALWNFALNTCLLNFDSYNGAFIHNYYLYQTGDGLFQMIPWDLSEAYVGNILGYLGGDSITTTWEPFDYGLSKPLFDTLLNDELYRMQYAAHIRTIMNESMDSAFVRTMIDEMQVLAEPFAISDTNKIHSNTAFHATVDSSFQSYGGIMSSLLSRHQFLTNHPEIALTPPLINLLEVTGNHVKAEVSNAVDVELMSTVSTYNSKFQITQMLDDGMNGDQTAGDGIYTGGFPLSPAGTEIKFYIRARNADALILSPERAEYEFYTHQSTVSISELELNRNAPTLVRITDILGRECIRTPNRVLLYIYDNGKVEKKVWLDN
jgi:hypothetical protein